AVDETGFATASEAVATIQAAGPGRSVTLKLVRDGQYIELPVTLGLLIIKDWKPSLLDAKTAAQTRWLIRDHPITILPAGRLVTFRTTTPVASECGEQAPGGLPKPSARGPRPKLQLPCSRGPRSPGLPRPHHTP